MCLSITAVQTEARIERRVVNLTVRSAAHFHRDLISANVSCFIFFFIFCMVWHFLISVGPQDLSRTIERNKSKSSGQWNMQNHHTKCKKAISTSFKYFLTFLENLACCDMLWRALACNPIHPIQEKLVLRPGRAPAGAGVLLPAAIFRKLFCF